MIRVADNPELAGCKGKTLITTDGTTLLGADDKAGIAIIMEAAAYLMAHPEIPHGPIRVCFTCDEEIGHGVDHLDPEELGARVGYTLDGGGSGEIDGETFSADLAVVTITGVNIHPAIGKGRMVNAVRLAGAFLDRLAAIDACRRRRPRPRRFPASLPHRRRRGPGRRSASCSAISTRRPRRTSRVAAAMWPRSCGPSIRRPRIDVKVTPQYRNMADGLAKEPRALRFAEEAMRRAGLEPKLTIVRGGTDGSRLTELGLPTPNLSTGEHNIHSPLEWTCLEEMATAVRVLVELARVWGRRNDQMTEKKRPSGQRHARHWLDGHVYQTHGGQVGPHSSP